MSGVSQPLVTVMIPSYNYGNYIAEAVDSALAQRHRNLDVLIMENASTDNTMAVLERYADEPRVRVIANTVNVGRAGNVNRGIAESRGEYIVTLPADDALLPDFISSALDYYRTHPWIDVLHRQFLYTDDTLDTVYLALHPGYLGLSAYEQRDELVGLLRFYSYAQLVTAVVPKWVFERVGDFDENLTVAFDFGYMTRIAGAGVRLAFRDEPVFLHRRHGTNASGTEFQDSGKSCTEYLAVVGDHVDAPQFREVGGMALAGYDAMAGRRAFGPEATALIEASRPRADALRARLAELLAQPRPLVEDARFSIVLPAGPDLNGLGRALTSLEQQTYTNWEVELVAYDAPDLDVFLGRYAWRDRIHYARLAKTGTPALARNAGLELARGDLIGFLSERETFAPDHLATAIAALRSSGAAIARSGAAVSIETAPYEEGLPPRGVATYYLAADGQIARNATPYPPLATICHRRELRVRFAPQHAYFSEWLYVLQLANLASGVTHANATALRHVPLKDALLFAADTPRLLESLDAVFAATAALLTPAIEEQRMRYRGNLVACAEGVRANPNDGRACAAFILALDDLALPAPAEAAT